MATGFFPYPGGKAQYADWIYQNFPDHECYVEPFGGGAGVLYHKPRSKIEVYNDLADEVWHFFDVYSRRGEELVDRLEDVYYAKGQYDAWEGGEPDDPIERAARFFFLRYANWGSKLEPSGFRRMKHRSVADQFRDAVEQLPEKRDRLHGVTIENLDFKSVVDKYDGDETLFYFDPPYVDVGDDLYAHDGVFDHGRFVDVLDGIGGYWALSYDKLPDRLPEFEVMVERKTKNRVSNGQEADPSERTERLIMNYDPEEVEPFAGAGQAGIGDF
jgi:DNA adenine methylase